MYVQDELEAQDVGTSVAERERRSAAEAGSIGISDEQKVSVYFQSSQQHNDAIFADGQRLILALAPGSREAEVPNDAKESRI